MLSPIERERLREGMQAMKRASTHDWRFYYSYLLGRPVTLEDTDRFLREEQAAHESRETQLISIGAGV
jgi:hypothetical protein